jgi:hypothetical protein
MPGCSKGVTKQVSFVPERGIWIARPGQVGFYCDDGHHKVVLYPKLIKNDSTSKGCEGCPFYTQGEREG